MLFSLGQRPGRATLVFFLKVHSSPTLLALLSLWGAL
jgi:hypothetical protein